MTASPTTRPQPRGIRNNNPLNLRISNNPWRGKIYGGTDKSFEEFTDVIYGIRAAMINIRTIIRRRQACAGNCTLAHIIRTWAPDSDGNNSRSYSLRVAAELHLEPTSYIPFQREIIIPLVLAMSKVENGGNYITIEQCRKAWSEL